MQGIDAASELNRVHKPVCFTCVVVHDFQNACATKTSERFGVDVLAALLRHVQREANRVLYVFRKRQKVRPCSPYPDERLYRGQRRHVYIMSKRA